MLLRLDTGPLLAPVLPEVTVSETRGVGGRRLAKKRHGFLLGLLEEAYSVQRPYPGLPDALTIPGQYLHGQLHTIENRPKGAAFLRPFFEFPETWGRKSGPRLYRPFRLRSGVAAVLGTVYGRDDPLGGLVELPIEDDPHATRVLPFGKLGESLPLGDLQVPTVLPVAPHAFERAAIILRERIAREGRKAPADASGVPLRAARQQLAVARQWGLSVGGLPNVTREYRDGSVRPVGLHVARLLPALRTPLLGDSGLVYYSLRQGRWTVIRALAEALWVRTPTLDAFLADPAPWYAHWRGITGQPGSEALEAIAGSWALGAGLPHFSASLAVRLLGWEAASPLREDVATVALHRDLRALLRVILAAHPTGENAIGQHLNPNAAPTVTRRVWHLVGGYVAWALRFVMARCRGLAAVLPDGFLAPPQDPRGWTAELATESAREFGVALVMDFDAVPFGGPSGAPETDDGASTYYINKASDEETTRSSEG